MSMKPLPQPDIDQIDLPMILGALADGTRLAIIGQLADDEESPMTCGQFLNLGAKTSLTYHIAKLREAGLVTVTPSGTKRLICLRRAELDSRFPGILDSIIANARQPELEA